MKKLTGIFLMVMMLSVIALFTGCQSADEGASHTEETESHKTEDIYTLILGHSDKEDNLIQKQLEHFADAVSEDTNGRVRIEIYPDEQLGSNDEMAQMLKMGKIDAMMMPNGVEAKYSKKLTALGLPFLFDSYEEADRVLDGKIGKELVEDMESNSMVHVAYWENGMRQITNNKREINSPADLKGLSIRIPNDEMTRAIMKQMGAKPSVLPFSKLNAALKAGIFDGQENPVANIYANKMYKVQKYLTLINYKYEPKSMVFSKASWDRLPRNFQKVIKRDAVKYGIAHRKAVRKNEKEMTQKLENNGMKITRPATGSFRKVTKGVYNDFYDQYDWGRDLVKRIRNAKK